jgi:hypothetical protein
MFEELPLLIPHQPSVRPCDGCTACCRIMEIHDTVNVQDQPMIFDKPRHQWCEHAVKGKGCAIYAFRPKACEAYLCVWAQGHGVAEMRPDRCGIVVDERKHTSIGPIYFLHEVRPNAFLEHTDMVGYWSLVAGWAECQMSLIFFNRTQGLTMGFRPTREQGEAIRNRMARPDAFKLRPWLARLGKIHMTQPPDLQKAEKVLYNLAWGSL